MAGRVDESLSWIIDLPSFEAAVTESPGNADGAHCIKPVGILYYLQLITLWPVAFSLRKRDIFIDADNLINDTLIYREGAKDLPYLGRTVMYSEFMISDVMQ